MNYAVLFVTLLFLPVVSFAQENGTFSAGEIEFEYTSKSETDGVTHYYIDNLLILTEHDLDQDADFDLWVLFQNDRAVLEAHDTSDTNEPDTYYILNEDGEVIESYGTGIQNIDRSVEVENKTEEKSDTSATSDLINKTSIETPNEEFNFRVLVLLIVISGGLWFYQKRKKLD